MHSTANHNGAANAAYWADWVRMQPAASDEEESDSPPEGREPTQQDEGDDSGRPDVHLKAITAQRWRTFIKFNEHERALRSSIWLISVMSVGYIYTVYSLYLYIALTLLSLETF